MRTTTLKLFVFATDRLRSFWVFLWMSVKDPNTDRRVCLKNKSKVLNKATRLHLQETVISLQLLFSSSPGEFYFVWETNMTIKLVFLQMESGGFIKTNIQKKKDLILQQQGPNLFQKQPDTNQLPVFHTCRCKYTVQTKCAYYAWSAAARLFLPLTGNWKGSSVRSGHSTTLTWTSAKLSWSPACNTASRHNVLIRPPSLHGHPVSFTLLVILKLDVLTTTQLR